MHQTSILNETLSTMAPLLDDLPGDDHDMEDAESDNSNASARQKGLTLKLNLSRKKSSSLNNSGDAEPTEDTYTTKPLFEKQNLPRIKLKTRT